MAKLETLFSTIFDRSLLAQAIATSPDIRFATANESFLKLVEHAWNELVGKTLFELEGWFTQEEQQHFTETLWTEHRIDALERRFLTRDYRVRNIILSAHVLDTDGEQFILIQAEDVTQERIAQQRMKWLQASINDLFQSSPQPMWLYDLKTLQFVEVNPAAERFYGYTRAEFLAMRITDIRPSYEVPKLLKEVERMRLDQTRQNHALHFQGVWEHQRKNGDTIYVQILSHTLELDDRPLVVVLVQDLTSSIESQRMLERTTSTLQTLISAAPLPILSYDLDGKVTLWSQAAEQVYGWSKEEAVGKPLPTIPEEIRAEFEEVRGRLLRGESYTQLETKRQTKAGNLIDVEMSAAPLRDSAGNITGIISINADITERKRAKELLDQMYRRNTEILESIRDAFYAVDSQWRFTYINRRAEELWGVRREEMLGRNIWVEFGQVVGTESYYAHLQAAADRRAISYETMSLILNRWISVSIYPSDSGLAVYFTDITARKQAEEALKQRTGELESLLEIGQSLSGKLEQNELLDSIVKAVVDMLPTAEASSLWLYDEAEQALTVRAHSGHDEQLSFVRIASDISIIGRVFSTGEAQYVVDTAKERVYDALNVPSLRRVRSTLCAPLLTRDSIIGVLCIDNFSQSNAFQENALRILRALASQAAVAIHNSHLFEQVIASRDRMRSMSQQIFQAQELERRRVARNLHDELGQGLLLLKLDMEIIRDNLPPSMAAFSQRLNENIRLAEKVTEQIRALSMDLRPSLLDDLGLVPTLEWYLRRLEERTGIAAELHLSGLTNRPLSETIETAVFRLVQEALTNTVRHADASTISVDLHYKADSITVSVADNGKGFDIQAARIKPGTEAGGNGLSGMRERLNLLDSVLKISSAPGQGTRIEFTIPFSQAEQEK